MPHTAYRTPHKKRKNHLNNNPATLSILPNPVCPVCKLPVYNAKFDGLGAFYCAECNGLAVPRDTMMKMRPGGKKPVEPAPEAADYRKPPFFEKREKPPFLICPFCGKKMETKKFGQMSLEVCEKCSSLWFDPGKELHVNDILGSYKMKMLNAKENGGRRR